MLRNGCLGSIVAAFASFGGASQAVAFDTIEDGVLTVCLPRNAGVIAGRRLTGGSGFDYRLSEDLAARLSLTLNVIWFENELEEESDPLRETYAMLSYGLCDILPGHPRYVRAVGTPIFERASLPRWLGMPQKIDPVTNLRQDQLAGFVDIKPITVSQGYMRSELGLVFREGTPEPVDLFDLDNRVLSFQQGTLSGAIVMTQAHSDDRARAHTMTPGARFLWDVEGKGGDLAIVDVTAFDNYLQSNPFTAFRLAEWRHPLGMDIGIAMLEGNTQLAAKIDAALTALKSENIIAQMAEGEGLTYAPPTSIELTPEYTMQTLLATR